MAAPSFRDRLLTRRGARALLSPVGIAGGVVAAAVTVALGLPIWAALALGLAMWTANVVRLLPRGPRRERIDPFTLQEPWRRFVQDALQARSRFDEAVGRAPAGPLRDHLREIADRMQTGVDECWLIAKRGQTLVKARRGIDVAGVERELGRLEARTSAEEAAPADPSSARVVESLAVQRATAERLDGVIDTAKSELRVLDARLDEAVARTLELSAHASTEAGAGAVSGLGTDVDALVSEMESLRQALDETAIAAQAGPAAGTVRSDQPEDVRRDLPPGGAR